MNASGCALQQVLANARRLSRPDVSPYSPVRMPIAFWQFKSPSAQPSAERWALEEWRQQQQQRQRQQRAVTWLIIDPIESHPKAHRAWYAEGRSPSESSV